jgi:nucleoside-diphosphate-sugar epimerase
LHLAAIYKLGIRDKKSAALINVEGTRNVLEVMKELEIKKGVYTSSLAVFSDTHGRTVDETYRFERRHISMYDETKWRAHYEVAVPMMEKGLPLVIVLPGAVYGAGDTSAIGNGFIDYLSGSLKMIPTGTILCWSYIDDVVQGHLLAMEKGTPRTSYIIAGPPAPIEDAFSLLEQFSGVKGPDRRTSPAMMRILSFLMKLIEPFVKPSPAYSSEGLRVMAGATYLGDNGKAKKELGYSPRPLEEGMRETAANLMETLGMKRI